MPCNAAVGDTNCTDDANCTISFSDCNTDAGKCQCLPNYYDDGTICKPKGDNGGDCTFNVANSCLYPGELVCKSDNKCSCSDTANTYWHATSCKAKGDNGGDCTFNVADSCLYPGELVCKNDNKCSCSDTANTYWHATSCKAKGDNGGNCTFNVANSCLYPGELVCKSDNKCSCSDTANTYWHATSCKAKGDNGGDCTFNVVNSCLYPGELVCKNDNKCSCSDTANTYWHATSCKAKGDNGGNCTFNVVNSCLYPGELVCKSDNKCSCSDTANTYWHATSCKAKGDNGGNCTFNVANSCLYPGELVCKSDNKCSCSDTANTYWHATSCKAKGDNGGDCTFNVVNSCLYPGELVCKSDNKCSCSDTANTYWHATSCKAKGDNGGNCTFNVANSCLYPGELVCKSDNKCSCSDTANTYWHATSCKAKGDNGGDCTFNVANSCLYPGELVCKSDNKCSCSDTANTYWHATSCKAKGDNGGDCTFNVANSCLYPGELVCKSDNKCSCSDTANTYWHATSCKAKGDNGGDCTFNVANSCLYPGELVCKSDNKCSCSDTANTYWHATSCKAKGDNGGNCTFNVANSCLYPGELVCKSDNKCSCSDTANTYWHATSCKAKGDNGGDCTFNVVNSCLYPGELVCKSDNKCSCSDTANTYWHATSCKAKGNNGGDCTFNVANSCLYPGELVCKNDNKCSCSDTANTYWHVTSCKAKGDNGGDCTFNVANSCLYPGELVCKSDNKCSCSDTANTYWHATSMTCKPKKSLGEDCSAAIECKVANSECATKCQCQVNFYDTNNADSGGTCEPLENLKVSNIQLETSSETYLVISWTAPPAAAAVEEYRFLVGGTSSEVSVGIQKGANVTGLTPGVMYNITVISVDSNSRPAVQKTSPAPVNQATKPAVPGPIDLTNSDLTASDGSITIRWKFTGTVTSYTVTVSELVINSATVNAPSYLIGNNAALRNGHRYTLSVKAHSNSLESAEYTEEFRTVIIRPNPPIIQSCTEIVSTSIDLVWQKPLLPNGDVQYYLIDTNGASAPPQINTSTSVATYKVEPLLEAHLYCFFVRTVNDGAENIQVSVNSNQWCCSTKAASSSEPTDVTTNVLSSRNISVSWNYPDNPKGDIFGYRLRLKVGDECQVEIVFYCSECPNAPNIPYKDCGADKQRQTITLTKNEINTTINYVVEQLLPYTKYNVWIAAHNAANDGMRHASEVQTISEVPQKPLSVAALVESSSKITVTWSQPIPRPGVTTYHVKAYEVVNGVEKFVKISNVSGYSIQTVGFSQLEAYWNYTFTVVATTDKGDSEQSDMSPINRTNQAAPGKVLNFDVVKPNNDEHRKLKVIWSIPELRNRNGLIEEYTVEHNTTGTTVSSTVDATMDNLEILFNITPEEYYDIKVYAVNTENEKGAKVGEVYYAKPGPPNVPTIPALVEETSSPPSTQTTIEVKFSLDWFLNTDNGMRTDGGIVICPKSSCDNYGDTSQMKEPSHFATLETWKKSKAKGFTQAYRVTNRTWISDHVNSAGRRKRSSQVVELTIGEESGCDKLEDDVYCNGPLPADIRIMVIAFVCTSGGCTESQQFGPYKTQPEPEALPIAIIAGVVSAVVVFLIIIIIIVVIKKRPRKNQPTKLEENEIDNFTNLNPHGLETPSVERKNIRKKRPIKLKDFEEKVAELHKDSNLKFAHEYEELKTLTDPKTLKNVSNSLAETEENKLKNRYVNILPYDHTIVKLLPLEDDDDQASTFINANYIPGYKSQREYIASQGPIPSTIDDFWRMVWEQSVSIIVMLTLAKEDGRIKCEMYWPTEQSEAKQFGDIVVEMQSCSTINTYEFRIFKMTLGDKSRTLKHFHFLNWKDFSANVQNDVMVDFISNVRSHVTIPESKVPMIVHCSAGVGRTGTFIALDHMMQFIRDHDFDSTIDIFDFVVKMRECRMYMVQTEQQYIFIHDCIKDILEKKRQKELEDGDGLYGNVDNDQDHNIYSNEAFEPEPELYQNFAIGQPKTEL